MERGGQRGDEHRPRDGRADRRTEVGQRVLQPADLAQAVVSQGFALSELVEAKPNLEQVFLDLTRPFNLTGQPAISIPCGLGEGDRPVGLMLTGKHWQEATLYRAADAFERSVNWQRIGPKR